METGRDETGQHSTGTVKAHCRFANRPLLSSPTSFSSSQSLITSMASTITFPSTEYRRQLTKSDASLVPRHSTAAIEVCNLVYSQADPVSWDTLSRFYEADAGKVIHHVLIELLLIRFYQCKPHIPIFPPLHILTITPLPQLRESSDHRNVSRCYWRCPLSFSTFCRNRRPKAHVTFAQPCWLGLQPCGTRVMVSDFPDVDRGRGSV